MRQRLFAVLAVVIILIGSNLSQFMPIAYADPVCGANQVGGTIFVDLDMDGDRDAGEPDIDSAAGIEVFAYDNLGNLLGSDINGTGGDAGEWQVNLGAYTGTVRIEFSLPAAVSELASARFATSGVGSGTTVAFVANGDCDIDLGLQVINPGIIGTQNLSPYSNCTSDNTDILTSCFVLSRGEFTTQGNDAVVSFGYDFGAAHPADRPFPDPAIAPVNQPNIYDTGGHVAEGFAGDPTNTITALGGVYGMAYHRASDSVFASAYLKRHSAFGSGGTGAIYRIDRRFANNDPQRYSVFATVPNAGADPQAALTTRDDWRTDSATFSLVSRRSLGDMDLDGTEENLWVMNLNDRSLYRLDIGNADPVAGAFTRYPAAGSLSGLVNGAGGLCAGQTDEDIVPFAVKVHLGQVYIGITCTAESLPGAVTVNRDAMRFLVYRLDPATATGVLGDFTLVLNVGHGDPAYAPNNANRIRDNNAWRRWNDEFYTIADAECSGGDAAASYAGFCSNPQPLLADLEFTDDNDVILGFRDRWGDMMGSRSFNPVNAADTFTYDGVAYGDILLACFGGANVVSPVNGDFVLENDGTCGGVTTGGSALDNLGPGEGSYYYEDYWFDAAGSVTNITLGGLAVVPGTDEVVTTVQDPISNNGATRDGGVIWLNNDTGQRTRSFRLFDTNPLTVPPTDPIQTFGKSNGLGDIEFNCLLNLEIGNRVWIDTNSDGVQDSTEPVVAGVTVTLYEDVNNNGIPDAGEERGTSVTDANGQFLFNETNVNQVGVYTGIKPFTNYLAVMNTPADFAAGGPLADYIPTTPNAVTIADRADIRDSDGIASALLGNLQFAQISFRSDGIGNNNHTFDFGFVQGVVAPVVPTDIPVVAPVAPANVENTGVNIQKIGSPQLALPGDTITWDIIITNGTPVDYPNFNFSDPIDSRLTILSTSSNFGTVSVDNVSNTVSYAGTIPANSVETVRIVTQLDPNIVPPFTITNTITNFSPVDTISNTSVSSGDNVVAEVQSFPTALPNTGDIGYQYIAIRWLLIFGIFIAFGLNLFFWRRQ
ncbi:MAG: hypothetical protein Phog2KO_32490 [Phototrophicaceae bacterium]